MSLRLAPAFVFAAAVVLGAGRPSASLVAQDGSAPKTLQLRQLRPAVFVASGFENGNVLVVASDTALMLVDAQSERRVAALDSVLRTLPRALPGTRPDTRGAAGTPRPVRLVVNTHYHADHTEGNAWFRGRGAQVLAHRAAIAEATKDTTIAEWDNWHRTPLPSAAMPTRAVDDSLELAFGGERVILLHAPRAHTGGDLMVWLPTANVLHIGDILEVGAPPFIDWWSGGSLRGMITAIDRVLVLVDDNTAIVPGHGAVSSRRELQAYRDMLATVDGRVAALVTRGATLAQVLDARPAREWEAAMGGERRAGHFVRLLVHGALQPR